MQKGVDIRKVKNDLRAKYKGIRKQMGDAGKQRADERIRDRFFRLRQYKRAKMLITYVSTAIEVDTREIMKKAWLDGKIVCVPRCREGTREMDFFRINSFDDLEKGTFGVLEPDPARCQRVDKFPSSICIVPGLAFDNMGFRLGYGKGYYDRFLSSYQGVTVGVCYNECMTYRLPHGRFDVPVDLLLTQQFLRCITTQNVAPGRTFNGTSVRGGAELPALVRDGKNDRSRAHSGGMDEEHYGGSQKRRF